MSITIFQSKISKRDYIVACFFYKRNFFFETVYITISAFFLWAAFYNTKDLYSFYGNLIVGLVALFLRPLIIYNKARKLYPKIAILHEELTFSFENEKICIYRTDGTIDSLPIDAISRVSCLNNLLLLETSRGNYFIKISRIPKVQRVIIFAFLSKPMKKTSKRRYSPLMIFAVNLAIAFVAIFGYLDYNLRWGDKVGDDFVVIAQSELDTLKGSLKKFKEVNGDYPDSLEQLRVYSPFINIQDPFLVRKEVALSDWNFHYEKGLKKYILFSVGKDGLPNTSDDIYPH